MPVLAWVNTPVVVPPSATQFVTGFASVPQQVPLEVMAVPPSDVTFAPSVAPVVLIAETVGVVTVGVVAEMLILNETEVVAL